MYKYLIITLKYFVPLVLFFLVETISHGNEYLPLVFILGYVIYLYKTSKVKKVETVLFVTGLFAGLAIELGMTQISRSQVWENTVFAIPMWLPFAWAVGAITFYRFGKEFE
jgi:hypothetical protein